MIPFPKKNSFRVEFLWLGGAKPDWNYMKNTPI